jgi:phosphoglycerate dehydrogenase-like enzyme
MAVRLFGVSLRRLQPFGVRLMAVRRSAWSAHAPDQDAQAALAAKGAWADMPRLAADADIIVLACSQDSTTRGFVNAQLLAACKPGVIIVNVARGAHAFLL